MAAVDQSAAPSPVEEESADQPQAAEVAAAETTGEEKVLFFTAKDGSERIRLILPPKLLGSVVFRAGILRDDDIAGASRLAQAVVGAEQFDLIMDAMDRAGVTTDDEEGMTVLGEFLNEALKLYGMTEGEAQASSES